MQRFTRVPTRTITTLAVIVLAAVAAYAAINYKSGPAFTIPAGSFDLVTAGQLSGLGGTAHVLVDAVGSADGSCSNKGGNLVPVHNATVSAAGSATIHPDSNGRSNFSVPAGPVANPNPCPNGNWTFDITLIRYNSAKVSISAGGSQSLVNTFTFTGPTLDGAAACESDGSTAVTCVQ